jgi:hypothetical protein
MKVHGQRVLEIQRGVRAERHLAMLLVGDDPGAKRGPLAGIFFQAEQIFVREMAHGRGFLKCRRGGLHQIP